MTYTENWQTGISTHTGPVKPINEDFYFMKMVKSPQGDELSMVAIADGMGGHGNGDEASKTAITMLETWWNKRLLKFLKKQETIQQLTSHLSEYMSEINEELKTNGLKGGTTLSVLLLYQGAYAICHVGDSRIYQIRGVHVGFQNFFRDLQQGPSRFDEQSTEELEATVDILQLTEDHSWVEQQVKKGVLTKEEARQHQKRNVLTQCLGIGYGVEPDARIGTYQSSDIFLLCSDGFYAMFPEEEIAETLGNLAKEYTDLQMMSHYLVNLAYFAGTKDNVTVMCIRNAYVNEPEVNPKSFLTRLKERWS